MTLLRRAPLVGLVWLTAIGTLLAGIPHVECVCLGAAGAKPDPRPTKPRQGCCCGTACSGHEGRCPFCASHAEPASEETVADGDLPERAVKPVRCRTAIVHREVVSTSANKGQEIATAVLAVNVVLPTPVIVPDLALDCRSIREIYRVPPPTDLVTLLQHFLI